MSQTTLVWFRRDLRLFDNAALSRAAEAGLPLVCVFVWEPDSAGCTRRAVFLWQCLSELHGALAEKGIPLFVVEGRAEEEIPALARRFDAACVVCAETYAPREVARDTVVAARLVGEGRQFYAAEDALLLPKSSLVDASGHFFTDFKAYKQAWLAEVCGGHWPVREFVLGQGLSEKWAKLPAMPDAAVFGADAGWVFKGGEREASVLLAGFLQRIDAYRFSPGLLAGSASQLSPHFCFGTVSLRYAVRLAKENGGAGAHEWLGALARREFYYQWFYHHSDALLPEWAGEGAEDNACLKAWREGNTGYPLVDAAMRCLNKTGVLQDALRSFAARFFTRFLKGDWRQGAAYFAGQLLDYDWVLNCGNWQDAAKGKGAFHPVASAQSIDPAARMVRRYVPELAHLPKDVIHTPWLVKGSVNTNGYPDPVA